MAHFTLFVARNHSRKDELCPGSTLCTEFLHNVDEREVEVVDCNRTEFKRPPWLVGTPTLYEHDTKRSWAGHQAVRRLYHMSLHYALTPPASASTSSTPSRPVQKSSPPPDDSDHHELENGIWDSQITPDMEDDSQESDMRSDRKMTSDDLNQAISRRMISGGVNANGDAPPTMNAPPPPPPALND